MTADQVVLSGSVGRGHHGVYAFERDQGQDFVVDVACTMDLRVAADSDDLPTPSTTLRWPPRWWQTSSATP